ncbi:MAG: GAF domain-containing protein [Anaerolineae bacterium]
MNESGSTIHRAQREVIALYRGLAELTDILAEQEDVLQKLQMSWASLSREVAEQKTLQEALERSAATANQIRRIGVLVPELRTSLDKLQARLTDQEKEQNQLRGLFNVSRAVNSTLDLERLLNLVMDIIIEVTGAERAFLMLIDKETGSLEFKVARNIDQETISESSFQISRSIVRQVAEQGSPVLTTNAQEDPRFSAQQSIISYSLRSILCVPLRVKEEITGVIYTDNRIKTGLFQPRDRDLLTAFADQAAVAIENARLFAETRQRLLEMNALYQVGQSITSTLNLDRVLQLITDEALKTIPTASKVIIHLIDESTDMLVPKALSHRQKKKVEGKSLLKGQGIAGLAIKEKRTIYVANTETDPRYFDTGTGLKSLIVAPLIISGKVIGTLSADSFRLNAFEPTSERLLSSLANQAAIAIDNARLFESVRQKMDEIATMKGFQDNIFASIASGVITTDIDDCITTFNRAAETILGKQAKEILTKPYQEALDFLRETPLPDLLEDVKEKEARYIAYEIDPELPQRGEVNLSMSLSPLKDADEEPLGVAIVVDDLTEKRRLEAEREREEREKRMIHDIFQRYVAPTVVNRLIADPSQVALGGTRQEITILFADIRGFTSFSEPLPPEDLVEILNRYLSLAIEAVFHYEGTLDKFMGDAVMAFFNAPETQPDHTLRAVKAALAMQRAIAKYHRQLDESQRLSYGIGINVGEAVVGNVGAAQLMNYTVIGDVVNLAKRLQEEAKAGQILLSQSAYDCVKGFVRVKPLKPTRVKGRSALEQIYELVGLKKRRKSTEIR